MFPLRDENPTHHIPLVTLLLIGLNGWIFFYQYFMGAGGMGAEAFLYHYAVLPTEIWTNENIAQSLGISPYLSLVSSMFLHGGLGHIMGNMWFLWIFGDNVEDYFGYFGFLFFYFITGIAAGLTHVVLNPTSEIPTVGASGAISGILGGYMILHPMIRIKTLIFFGFFMNVIRVPAVFFLGLWFLMQLLGGLSPQSGIAFGAHIGGFVAGVLLTFFCSKKSPVVPTHRYDNRRYRRW